MILLSHPTGNENVRQAALALHEAGLLREFWTCLSWNDEAPANRFLPAKLRQQLSRRSFHPALRPLIRTAPAREMGRLLAGAIGVSAFSQHETGPLSIDAVFAGLDRKVAGRLRELADCRAVYCYEDGALETFRAAQERNLPRLYDLPIGYWRVAQQIYAEERTREPEWAVTLSGIRDSAEKLARKEEELKLATSVVVASSFTKETLRAAEFTAGVTVIPYGAPSVAERAIASNSGKLRVLYVGSLGQRKGLSYLLRAIDLLGRGNAELTLIGKKVAEGCRPLEEAIRRHHWIPTLPHGEILARNAKARCPGSALALRRIRPRHSGGDGAGSACDHHRPHRRARSPLRGRGRIHRPDPVRGSDRGKAGSARGKSEAPGGNETGRAEESGRAAVGELSRFTRANGTRCDP